MPAAAYVEVAAGALQGAQILVGLALSLLVILACSELD